jgi:hypothetical protein
LPITAPRKTTRLLKSKYRGKFHFNARVAAPKRSRRVLTPTAPTLARFRSTTLSRMLKNAALKTETRSDLDAFAENLCPYAY